jgi:hypothetical protein
MKILNKVLCLTALFAIGSVSAKYRGGAAAKPAGASKAPATSNVPTASKMSFKQIRDSIPASAIVNGTNLNNTIVNTIESQVTASGLGAEAFRALLQTARDKYAKFSNDNNQALNELRAINEQINNAIESFKRF